MKKMLLIDAEQCGGCQICETACSWAHAGGTFNPRAVSAIHVIKDDREGTNVPFMCLQCEVAYCQQVCPVHAIGTDAATGAKLVDAALCIGCRMCIIACPFGGVMFDAGNARIVKCDFCREVGEPQCAKWCPKDALHFVDTDRAGLLRKDHAARRLAVLAAGH